MRDWVRARPEPVIVDSGTLVIAEADGREPWIDPAPQHEPYSWVLNIGTVPDEMTILSTNTAKKWNEVFTALHLLEEAILEEDRTITAR